MSTHMSAVGLVGATPVAPEDGGDAGYQFGQDDGEFPRDGRGMGRDGLWTHPGLSKQSGDLDILTGDFSHRSSMGGGSREVKQKVDDSFFAGDLFLDIPGATPHTGDMTLTPSLTLSRDLHRTAATTCLEAAAVCRHCLMGRLALQSTVLRVIDLAATKSGDAGGPRRDLWTALDWAEKENYPRAGVYLTRQAAYHEARAAQYDSLGKDWDVWTN